MERLRAALTERRALMERVAQRRLEGDDWAVVNAVISEAINEVERGQQEWLTLELPEEEEASEEKTIGAVGAEGSTSNPRPH